jgi:hypothetical protein
MPACTTRVVHDCVRRTASVALLSVALLLAGRRAGAQVRERPVPFDSAGRVAVITPPLAARLGLAAPAWPVSGDYHEARLYEVGDSLPSYVIVVRRQRDVLDRYPLDAACRVELAMAIARGTLLARTTDRPDSLPTFISEPVRGQFVASQTALGALLFGPAAAGMIGDPAAGTAAYLLVTGGSFFTSAGLTQSTPVSRAQNHLATHSAVRGAIAGNLALFAVAGGNVDGKAFAAATLLGGIVGDVVGFQLAKPMTDAEAHGTAHGSTVTALLTTGTLGAVGALRQEGSARGAAAGIIAAGALGYPLGLRYVRGSSYRVTAGDIGAMFTSELLGLGAAATVLPDSPSEELVYGALTAGYALGVLVGDRALVRPFDHTESEARLLALGTGAGAVMGLVIPVLAASSNPQLIFGTATIGGIFGAILTEGLISPRRARPGESATERRTGSIDRSSPVDVRFSAEGALMAGSRLRGNHPILSLTF